ncbi:hypothetical protein C2G38_2174656 [Gigaspora rosea]|uniref:Uncharacterized protein n=1 Tax=Gigaspora rosea TaxID=44941 RepID=A0A397VMA7_9GLOM|nr:hypothetical protein C2G38_2174656 [Gigaspora rosea]
MSCTISPFNDQKGIYKAFCKGPKSGYLDMRLVMYTNPSHPDDVSSENFTYKNNTPIQRSRKKLGTVVKLDLNFIDSYQNLYRALLIRYFEKAWDCDDLPALIDLLFNYSIIIEDDLKDKCNNLIHRDNKQRNSGGVKSKQEFDECCIHFGQ